MRLDSGPGVSASESTTGITKPVVGDEANECLNEPETGPPLDTRRRSGKESTTQHQKEVEEGKKSEEEEKRKEQTKKKGAAKTTAEEGCAPSKEARV